MQALDDIQSLQKLDGELMVVTKRQGVAEGQIQALQTTTSHLGDRVEICAQEPSAHTAAL